MPHYCASAPTAATAAFTATAATLATAPTAAMASPTVLTFDTEGRAVDFDVWVDDLQLFLQCDSRDGVSLLDHTSGVSTAPAATADSTLRSQWTTRDVVARLAVRSHLPPAERAHFGQYKTAQSINDAVVAHYSSPATAALSHLMLPYLFPDLAAFATVADLVAHLRSSDARYRAALPTEFCAKNPTPMYITLYYLVTCLPDSLSSVRDHFLSLCPTELTVDLLEERLAAAQKSILAVVGNDAPARAREARVVAGAVGEAVEEVEAEDEVEVVVGVVPGVEASVAAVEAVAAVAEEVAAAAAVVEVAEEVVMLRTRETHSVQQLHEWYAGRGRSGGAGPCTYVLRTGTRSGEVCGLPHTTQRCFGRLTDAWRTQFPDVVELPHWDDLLLQNVPIFDLDFDAILAVMYALADITEGDCYLSVPPDPGTVAAALRASVSAALGASASAAPGTGTSTLSGTAPTESLHTFTLDSGASRSFFRDSTMLTPLSRPVAVSLADPSGGPVLAHSSTVLPCPSAPSGLLSGLHLPSFSTNLVSGADLQDAWVDQFTPGGQRVTQCTCSRTGRHLATFTRRPGSSLYTLTTAPPPASASGQVAASSQVFAAASRSSPASAPYSCCPLAHETLLWHHRLGHPSLPRLQGMASRAPVSGPPMSLPPLPPRPAPTCVPCVEGRQRAAPHSSSFPPTEAPLQTLHMDVWGPARVRGQGHERYFLLVVDDYSRYTTVFPLRRKGEVTEVLIDWIRGARRQLSESFSSDLLVLRLYLDRGGEFSPDLLRAFCRSEGILQKFTLPASPQQNGIAERHIGMYVAHQINLQPRVSLPETTPTLWWTGKVGDATAFRFYHPTSRRVLSSLNVTFDESVSYYRLFPYRIASPPPPPPLFLAPGTPPVDPVPPQSPAPSGVSQVDPAEPVEVAVDSGAARGADPAGAETGGAESWGAETGRAEPGGVAPEGTLSGGSEPAHAESGGALGVPSRKGALSPQRLLEWYSRRCRVAVGAGAGATGAAGGAAGAGTTEATGGAEATRAPGGAGAAGGGAGVGAAGGAAGAGAAGGAAGAGAAGGAGGATGGAGAAGGAAGAGAAGGTAGAGAAGGAAGTRDPGAEGTGSVSAISGGAVRPRPHNVPLLQQVLGSLPSPGPPPPFLSPPPVQSQSQLQPASLLPGPSPYSGLTRAS
ncbi:unnamed protein product [Closterium sp. NIES-53]